MDDGGIDVVFNVLVVDDDPVVRQAVTSLLGADPQLEVVDAVDTAEAALEIVRSPDRDLDLVVLDDALAGQLTGQEVAPLLKQADPGLKVILFSVKAETGKESDIIDAFVSKSHVDLLVSTARLVLGVSWAKMREPEDTVVNVVTRESLLR